MIAADKQIPYLAAAANTKAIGLPKRLEAEGRNAAPDEQEILSRYAGWGGVPDAFESDKPEWADGYAELKSLLTDEEWNVFEETVESVTRHVQMSKDDGRG